MNAPRLPGRTEPRRVPLPPPAAPLAGSARKDRVKGRTIVPAWPAWIPLATLPPAAGLLCWRLPAWAQVWALAGTIFFGFKWLTWWRARPARPGRRGRSLGYLLLWPGMDAERFIDGERAPPAPRPAHWLRAALKAAAGAALVGVAAGHVRGVHPLLVAWAGWIGLLLLLHFGLVELLACAWQARGVEARPLMRSPFLAKSLGEFWGRRWNVAFHELTRDLVYRPLRARLGTGAATLIAFTASGLLHDLVISLPARGGWGLPTAYFVLQAAGVTLERSTPGRRLGLDRPLLSRAFIAACAAAPAFLLFHPPFMERVVLPFLEALGELASAFGSTGTR